MQPTDTTQPTCIRCPNGEIICGVKPKCTGGGMGLPPGKWLFMGQFTCSCHAKYNLYLGAQGGKPVIVLDPAAAQFPGVEDYGDWAFELVERGSQP